MMPLLAAEVNIDAPLCPKLLTKPKPIQRWAA